MRIIASAVLAIGLGSTAAFGEITAEQMAGKTLTLKKSTFMIGTDGSLAGVTDRGETVSGTWSVVDGKWCRTITEPARLAGKACQTASIKGRNFTLVRDDGTSSVWKMK